MRGHRFGYGEGYSVKWSGTLEIANIYVFFIGVGFLLAGHLLLFASYLSGIHLLEFTILFLGLGILLGVLGAIGID